MKMMNSKFLAIAIVAITFVGCEGEVVEEVASDPCHTIQHADIDLSLKSMDDYAEMRWEDHRATYSEDGTVHLNTLEPEKLKGIDESIESYKAQRASGTWSEFFGRIETQTE